MKNSKKRKKDNTRWWVALKICELCCARFLPSLPWPSSCLYFFLLDVFHFIFFILFTFINSNDFYRWEFENCSWRGWSSMNRFRLIDHFMNFNCHLPHSNSSLYNCRMLLGQHVFFLTERVRHLLFDDAGC